MLKAFIRYPGSKSRHTGKILRYFNLGEPEYREPFIGGGSVFLASEFEDAWINDIDPDVYKLWVAVRDQPNELVRIIEEHTPILDHKREPQKIKKAMELWREIQQDVPSGYRTLFLSKTCFSGVLSGGPTGGIHQTGEYTLFSRWAPNLTISRIWAAHSNLQNVRITNESWQVLVEESGKDISLYLDPPYLKKGGQCYNFSFTLDDHKELAETVSQSSHRYVVTVDDCKELRDIWTSLVPEHLIISEKWLYSMSDYREENREGREMFVVDQRSYDLCRSTSVHRRKMEEFE